MEPTEPIDRIEPALPTLRIDPAEKADNNEPAEKALRADITDPTERAEAMDPMLFHDQSDIGPGPFPCLPRPRCPRSFYTPVRFAVSPWPGRSDGRGPLVVVQLS